MEYLDEKSCTSGGKVQISNSRQVQNKFAVSMENNYITYEIRHVLHVLVNRIKMQQNKILLYRQQHVLFQELR